MLTGEQRTTFEERGVLALRGAVDPSAAAELRERVLAFIAERKLVARASEWGPMILPSATAPLVKTLGFEETWGARARGAIDDLLGPGRWRVPESAGQLLFVIHPSPGATWHLPHGTWHLDYMAPGSARGIPGVQVFLLLDRVESRAGALRRRNGPAWPGRSADVRKQLRREVPWLRELWSPSPDADRPARFMERATVFDGVSLRVVEATGEAGDVIVMHPWMLHAVSPNCGARPRIALTERIHVREAG